MLITQERITPERATTLLAANTANRPLKRAHLEYLCKELVSGRWVLNGDAIRISNEGTVLDGQHRLRAVVKTGIPIDTIVVSGLPRSVFETIDTGAVRTASDTLAVAGEKNGTRLAAAVLIVEDLANGRTDFTRPLRVSNSDVLASLARHPEIRDSVAWGNGQMGRYVPPSLVIALHYLFSRVDKSRADSFMRAVATGANLEPDSPVFLLRSRLIENLAAKAKLRRRYLCALTIKAFNSYVSGSRLKALRFREEGPAAELFPSINRKTKETA